MPDVSPSSIHVASQRILHDSHYASRCVVVAVGLIVNVYVCMCMSGQSVCVYVVCRTRPHTVDRNWTGSTKLMTHPITTKTQLRVLPGRAALPPPDDHLRRPHPHVGLPGQ